MSDDFDYKKFLKYVFEKYSETFTIEEIEELFSLNDDYGKDDPKSQGKILVINQLLFSGIKSNQETFSYKRKFEKGINIWIADNFKGKSTIFKIIKYCLTGNNTIKKAIKDWFKDILLEFSLTNDTYTVHIDARAYHVNCSLYKFGINEFQKLQTEDKLNLINSNRIFKVTGEKNFEEKMEEFFFSELSYYTLQYRHRPGLKNESVEANTSWSTYFKSIYLESANYEHLYFEQENIGKQGTKILEMLLGLHLTYPINQLTLLRDFKEEKIRNANFVFEKNKKSKEGNLSSLTEKLKEIENKLAIINKQQEFQSFENQIKEYKDLESIIITKQGEYKTLQMYCNRDEDRLLSLSREFTEFEDEIKKRENEVKKIDKEILQKELYIDTDSFFTNLDVHECPHCETPVTNDKKLHERHSHQCSLCGTTMLTKKTENEQQKRYIIQLKTDKYEIEKNINDLKGQLNPKKVLFENIQTAYSNSLASLRNFQKPLEQEERLLNLGDFLNKQTLEKEKYQERLEMKDDYNEKKGALLYQIQELKKIEDEINPDETQRWIKEVDILSFGIEALMRKRVQLNHKMMEIFQNLIHTQIVEYGINTITSVKIDEKYDLILVQHNKELKFDDLVEGEKLRVKLAFYLALIQLDIDHQLGRHPRFFIFDAPGSEEMIKKHLHGLTDTFKKINEKFQNNLQIFVGSAVRDFSEITTSEKAEIKMEEEFLF